MTAADAAAEVMRRAREYGAAFASADVAAHYLLLNTAVTALAERAYPLAGEWETRRHTAGGFDYFAAEVRSSDQPALTVAKVYADPTNAEVEIGYFGPLNAAEAREVAARLVEAADRLDAATP